MLSPQRVPKTPTCEVTPGRGLWEPPVLGRAPPRGAAPGSVLGAGTRESHPRPCPLVPQLLRDPLDARLGLILPRRAAEPPSFCCSLLPKKGTSATRAGAQCSPRKRGGVLSSPHPVGSPKLVGGGMLCSWAEAADAALLEITLLHARRQREKLLSRALSAQPLRAHCQHGAGSEGGGLPHGPLPTAARGPPASRG